jgi:hypothetical protein
LVDSAVGLATEGGIAEGDTGALGVLLRGLALVK